MTALEHIRRRSRAMAWAMMPLLALVWLGTSAACPGMTPGDASVAAVPPVERTAHDHGSHAQADHGGDSHAHSHSQSGADDASMLDHSTCPHCVTPPSSGEIESGHVVCDGSDGAVAATPNAAAHWDLKPFLTPIAWIAPAEEAPLIRTSSQSAYPAPTPEPRSLNVRYCVFLL